MQNQKMIKKNYQCKTKKGIIFYILIIINN